MIDVVIEEPFEQGLSDIILNAIEKAIGFAGADREWINTWDCSVLVTDDETIQSYNQAYRGIDKPTDVLSFESHEIDPETNQLILGDILISYPTISKQAEKGGHAVEKELELMCVHGALHLMGYDHLEEDEKAEMWALQTKILTILDNDLRPD